MGLGATIKDVAAAAGVSTKTVSRALKGERYVGAKTRDKVLATAAALGFSTGERARAGQVALIHRHEDRGVASIVAGMTARCGAAGVRVIAQGCDPGGYDVAALLEVTPLDGAVLLPPLDEDPAVLAALAAYGVRAVSIAPAGARGASVGADEALAAAVVTRHLLELGHRRIGYVDAPGSARERGHRAALAAAGIDAASALFVAAAHDYPSGARAGAALLELAEPPTAVFAGSDTIAAGVLTAVHARGLRVPEDVSVAGFGDEPLAAYVWPPLTTVRVSARAMGEAAADLLLLREDGRRDIPFDLVERASVIGIGV